ncbi:MAG TPA: lipocalin-like domain-containing protein [Candidatus Acidoferrum sp.]|nr:lipocalin-like domain-containing protein [Candidatus Acidoferrum sp.]
MRNLVKRGVMVLLSCMTATMLSGEQVHAGDKGVKIQFVGAWRLVSLETPGPDGQIRKTGSTGMFTFTRDGHASVQVMERNPTTETASESDQYSHGGYEATFGSYEVDESAHTFTFHVEGALVRSLIGKDLPRSFEFSGNRLIVKSIRPEEHWKVTWEHY